MALIQSQKKGHTKRSRKLLSAFFSGYKSTRYTSGLDRDVKNSWQWAERFRTYMRKPVDYHSSRLEPWKTVLEDKNEKKVVMKSRKITASEQMINECFFALETNEFCNFAFVFPQQEKTANPFSRSRIRPAINDSHRLRTCMNDAGTESKSFIFRPGDEQFIYIYGVLSNSNEPGDSFRGSVLRGAFYDEVQLIPLEAHSVIDQAKKPDIPFFKKWCSGTPTTPGNALNGVFWENSNQNLCLFKCPACNAWNDLKVKTNIFYNNFNPTGALHPEFNYPLDNLNEIKDAYLGCYKCGRSLEPYRGYHGKFSDGAIVQWVPQKIDRKWPYAGYFMNKLILGLEPTPLILEQLMDPQYTKRKKYNEILGYPYVGDDSPFSFEAMKHSLLTNLTFGELDRENFDFFVCTVDWGKPSWFAVHGFKIDNKKDTRMMLFDVGQTPPEMDERFHGKHLTKVLARKWPDIDLIVCDEGYSIERWKDFNNFYSPSIVFAVSSQTGDTKNINLEEWNIDLKTIRKSHIIKAPRDFLLERFETNLDQNNLKWFVPYADPDKMFHGMELKRYLLHCTNVYRKPHSEFATQNKAIVEIKKDKTVYYKDAGSDDHCLMLFSYASLLTIVKLRKILLRR